MDSKYSGGSAPLLLSKKELAATLGVSPRLIDQYQAAKRIPYLKLSERFVRFSLPKVLAALDRYEVKAGVVR